MLDRERREVADDLREQLDALGLAVGHAPLRIARDEDLAKQLSGAVGQQIRLHYTEHRGIPTSCFAETPYFAESFTAVSGNRPPSQ